MQPRNSESENAFEKNQRTIDDISTIVINQSYEKEDYIKTSVYDSMSYIAPLPPNYMYFASGRVIGSKGGCKKQKLKVSIRQHDDEHELSPFDRSSFEWRVANIRFIKEGIRIFTDGTFEVEGLQLDYVKRPAKIHNAQDYVGGTYTTMTGEILTGSRNCELPIETHSDVVDLAVLIASGNIGDPNYALKMNKENFKK